MSEDEKRNLRRRTGSKRTSPAEDLLVDTTTSRPAAKKTKQAHHKQASFRWMDPGTTSTDGTISHTTLEVCNDDGSCYRVCLGDAVKLQSDDNISLSPQNMMVATSEDTTFIGRIERMWEVSSTNKRMNTSDRMTVRWYFKKQDIEALDGSFTGQISREELVTAVTPKDLILSNQTDDNDTCSIVGKCHVLLRRPSNDPLPADLPKDTFVSRYSISFRPNPRSVIVTAYDGPNDDWPAIGSEQGQQDGETAATRQSTRIKHRSSSSRTSSRDGGDSGRDAPTSQDVSSASSGSSSDEESSDDVSMSSQEQGPETEGSTTKGHINVGPEHQVKVAPFAGSRQVKSRSPVLMWKPSALSEDELDNYLARAGDILTAFLEENGLLPEEPYAPLPSAKWEARLKLEANPRPMTLSNVSTGSSMVSKMNGRFTRECKIDSILEILVKKDYNVQAALSLIAGSPRDFLTIWTKMEKEAFDRGFRRHTGSLRAIRKMVAPSKSYKDVVDYHYRFKIPDQYRRYQEKTREQAVRMMECIEKRRYHDNIVASRDDSRKSSAKDGEAGRPSSDWSKTGSGSVIGAVEERRVAAKDLLMEVQEALGNDKLTQLINAVKELHDPSSIGTLKNVLVDLLKDHPDLLERSMEFLPRRFRT